MKHKLGICIPYRNRKEHIERLIPHLGNYLTKKGIDHKFYVGHQVDEKLFNRGAMKNIAAYKAFEDGCDYIAWHDVDMLPYTNDESTLPDYSYPETEPIHIATKLSKYGYNLGYDQYFGGVVLLTKKQVEEINGYSNDYWDWGQEDDDLFWRCHYEGYSTFKTIQSYTNKGYIEFNGTDSSVSLPTDRTISSVLHNNHTVSVLFCPEQQDEKVPIWLVGDPNKVFVEYPVIRKDGSWTWGLSFNNSRAMTLVVFDRDSQHHYNWAKRFENMWTWLTYSFNSETKEIHFFVNNDLITNYRDVVENVPISIGKDLKSHDAIRPFLLGFCEHHNTHFKGKIAEVKIFNEFFDDMGEVHNNTDNLVLQYDFNDGDQSLNDLVNPDYVATPQNVTYNKEDIQIIENIIPHRREGSFYCLPHKDEGYVNGTWAKGETTARNERRFVTQMQQNKINYKDEGFNKIIDVLDIVEIDEQLYPNTMFINVTMR